MFPNIETELTDEQIDNIKQAQKMIPQLQEQIRRAKLAGIDVTDQETQLVTLKTQLDKLERVYVRRTSSSK